MQPDAPRDPPCWVRGRAPVGPRALDATAPAARPSAPEEGKNGLRGCSCRSTSCWLRPGQRCAPRAARATSSPVLNSPRRCTSSFSRPTTPPSGATKPSACSCPPDGRARVASSGNPTGPTSRPWRRGCSTRQSRGAGGISDHALHLERGRHPILPGGQCVPGKRSHSIHCPHERGNQRHDSAAIREAAEN